MLSLWRKISLTNQSFLKMIFFFIKNFVFFKDVLSLKETTSWKKIVTFSFTSFKSRKLEKLSEKENCVI